MDIELLGPSKKNCGKPSLARFVIFRKYFASLHKHCAPLQLGWTETARSGSLKQWQKNELPGDETFSQSDGEPHMAIWQLRYHTQIFHCPQAPHTRVFLWNRLCLSILKPGMFLSHLYLLFDQAFQFPVD